jgi:hypothetical protein
VGRPKKDRIVHQQEEYNGHQHQQQQQELDYETSLRGLCRDYLNFESYFGSEQSYTNASKAVQRELAKAYTEQQDHYHQYHVEPTITTNTKATQPESFHRKRKVEDDQVDHDVDMEDGGDASNEPTSKKSKRTPELRSEGNNEKTEMATPLLTQLSVQTSKHVVVVVFSYNFGMDNGGTTLGTEDVHQICSQMDGGHSIAIQCLSCPKDPSRQSR